MLRARKGFENSTISFKVGANTFTIKVSDITPELMDKVKHHTDLSYFVEEYDPITEYIPEEHDSKSIIQAAINEPKKKNTNKKKKP